MTKRTLPGDEMADQPSSAAPAPTIQPTVPQRPGKGAGGRTAKAALRRAAAAGDTAVAGRVQSPTPTTYEVVVKYRTPEGIRRRVHSSGEVEGGNVRAAAEGAESEGYDVVGVFLGGHDHLLTIDQIMRAVEYDDLPGLVETARTGALQERLLRVVRDLPDGTSITASGLARKVGSTAGDARDALRALVEAGRLAPENNDWSRFGLGPHQPERV